jgi:predicted nucleotidyltransferase
MNDYDKKVIDEFKSRIPEEMYSSICKIIIFGSRARGDSSLDSDLDIAVFN